MPPHLRVSETGGIRVVDSRGSEGAPHSVVSERFVVVYILQMTPAAAAQAIPDFPSSLEDEPLLPAPSSQHGTGAAAQAGVCFLAYDAIIGHQEVCVCVRSSHLV